MFRSGWRRGNRSATKVNFVHLNGSLPTEKLLAIDKNQPAPKATRNTQYILGVNHHQGKQSNVGLTTQARLRHIHIIGATGTGKSTLLTNLIVQNILKERSGGLVLDPHGDLIDDIIAQIPDQSLDKFIVIDPSDQDFSIGFNLLKANSEHEKVMLASDLTSVFRQHATSWGDQMDTVMQNAIGAFLDHPEGGTLIDLRRFLIDEKWRNQYLEKVSDPLTVSYWLDEFSRQRSGSVASLLARLQLFLRPKPVRYMLMQKQGLDFRHLMNDGMTVLVKLSQGLIGEENSHLLGSMILTKVYQAALGRQLSSKEDRLPFYLYLDEFQNFITPTLEGILSGARKYGIGLVLAHQNLHQLQRRNPSVASSVMANAGTQIMFRLGRNDSSIFQQGLEHFEAEDLQKLSIGEAVIKVGASDQDCIIKTSLPDQVANAIAKNRYDTARYISNLIFGTSIDSLEAIIAKEYVRPIKKEKTESEQKPEPKKPKPETRTEPEKEAPVSKPQKPVTKDKPSPPPGAPIKTFKKDQPPIPADFDKKAKELLKRKAKEKEETDHRALQKAIKRLGDGMNYRSIIEAPTPDGKGRVDVLLEKDSKTIACEVAMTTNNQHEVKNIRKCLKAGYSTVAMICENPKRLANIKALSQKSFSQSELKKVWFVNQAGFTQALAELARRSNTTEQTIKGYRVKTNYIPIKGKDASEMQRRLTEIVMRKKK